VEQIEAKQSEPAEGEVRTITWMKGRNDGVVTWELGKLGVLAREATERPNVGEMWVVQVVKDTAPGTHGGVLILLPVRKVTAVEIDESVAENAIEDVTNVVQLSVNALCEDATVEVVRTSRLVRYTIQSDQDTRWLFGHDGATIAALRTVVAAMLLRAGARGWVDFGEAPPAAECECGERYTDPVDFDMRTTGPSETEERFEDDRPTYYARRTCGCGVAVYMRT